MRHISASVNDMPRVQEGPDPGTDTAVIMDDQEKPLHPGGLLGNPLNIK